MKKKQYFEMGYRELDELIEKSFGHPYEMVAYEELGNDSSWTAAFKIEPLDKWQQEDIDAFIASGKIKNWRTRALMQHMVNTGVLKPGNYLIEISW